MSFRHGLFYLVWGMLFSLSCGSVALAATLDALVDRSQVDFGQSVNLTVTATGLNGEIDFTVLEDDFEILDTSRSRNVQIINGKSDSSLVWQIGLMPLKAGELRIPSFSIDGVQSKEVVLSVKEARVTQQDGPAGQDFFLEITADKSDAFVQEQIIVTARVYQARNIIEGSLSDPSADGLVLQRLGSDQTFTTTLDGRQYNVIERRYAIFAQESGGHTISPLRLVATVRQNSRSGSNSGFFTPTQKVRVASNSLVLSIKPKLANGQSGWWLPAETLSLMADWNEDITQARVDQPITRNISLSAKAVLSTQLPPMDVPTLEGAKIYPDQPDIQTQTDGESLITYRTDKWAIIPRSVGPLSIPEIRIEWYDTINKKLQYAILPEQVIEILAAENAATSDNSQKLALSNKLPDEKSADSALLPENPVVNPSTTNTDDLVSKWKLSFYSVLLLWLVTLGLWFWQQQIKTSSRKLKAPAISVGNNPSVREVEEACKAGDPKVIVQSLLSFAKKKWPENTPHSIGELSLRLNHKPLSTLLSALDRAVYAKSSNNTDFTPIAPALKSVLKSKKQSTATSTIDKNLLPEL